uniref:Uncharacterized protein n=1 Tax=Asparagus officinalis TaxID=4686 RepID=Q2XNU6_ASPOF|nr:hypothetical protein 12.t00043 [Asparagus officinalis]
METYRQFLMPTDTPSKAFRTRLFYRRGWNTLDVIGSAFSLCKGPFILVRLLEYAQFKLLRYWSMVVPSVGITGPTMKVDSSACVDLILKLLDAQVTRPTSGAGASMTRTYRIFGKFSAINGFDEPLPTTV